MKNIGLSILLTACLTPMSLWGISLPAGPDVSYDNGFEGTWVASVPAGCGGIEDSTPSKRTKATLRLCIVDSENGTDKEIRGTLKTKKNLRMLQDDATYQLVGKRLRIIDSMSLSNDDPSRNVMTELRGRKARTTNLVLSISDGLEEDKTDAGDLVGTMGNCGVGMIWKLVKATKSCKFKKKKRK